MDATIGQWIRIVVMRLLREKNLTRLDTSILLSAGILGYVQARSRFDPSRGVKFKTYAEHRIKGAVLDEVRKMIGDERCKTKRPRKIDFDYTLISDSGYSQRNIESEINLKSLFESLNLNERERGVLESRVLGMTLREIAKAFDFSESRASQILAKIKKRIYVHYKDLDVGFKTYSCPSCDLENVVFESTLRFTCESCDLSLIIVDGYPIATDEVENEEEDESQNS